MTTAQAFAIVYRAAEANANGHQNCAEIHEAIAACKKAVRELEYERDVTVEEFKSLQGEMMKRGLLFI